MKYWFTTLMLITVATLSYGQEAKRMAVVETSTCYMRIAPDYESALETQELMGTVVEIVGESGYWREIVSPQPYKAWTTEKTLVEMSEKQIKEYVAAPKYMFTELYGHVYMEPSEKAQTICDLVGGDVLRVALNGTNSSRQTAATTTGEKEQMEVAAQKETKEEEKMIGKMAVTKGKWVQVMLPSGAKGWVLKSQVRMLGERVDIRIGDQKNGLTEDKQEIQTGGQQEGVIGAKKMEDIIASAHQLLGVPYLWGGMSSKGVDCSGLVRISAIMNDVLLPRNASQQIFCGAPVEMQCDPAFWDEDSRIIKDKNDRAEKGEFKMDFIEEMNERVKNLRRGDLVFFGTPATAEKPRRVTHVGIYLGGNRIIHSSHKVRINSLIPGDADYYENAHRLMAACRY